MSIIEVAKIAGVSKSTVSRVINESGQVKPGVVTAVRNAMKQLGYEPPLRRRGPKPASRRGIRTGNIALLVMGLAAADLYRLPVFPALLFGVERGLAEQGLNLILANLSEQQGQPSVLTGNQADGLLLFGKWDGMPESTQAKLRERPAVWVMREHSDEESVFDHVFYDNAAVGRLAARHLVRQGHRRLAYMNVLQPEHSAFAQRQKEFAAAAKELGASVESFISVPHDAATAPEMAVTQAAVDQMLAKQPRPTAMFVPTDAQLPGIYHSLEARRVRPMKDIEIVSCDNEQQFLTKLSPPPPTIDLNLELVGRRAVQQLLWRMRNVEERSRITILVEPTLVNAIPQK
jgi:LacI family transcriptional regulator